MNKYVSALDLLLLMDRKLEEAFKAEDIWVGVDPSEQIGFDLFYDKLSTWAVEQSELTYEDFAQIDFDRQAKIDEYKNKTDKM